jgi:hypothetical protein
MWFTRAMGAVVAAIIAGAVVLFIGFLGRQALRGVGHVARRGPDRQKLIAAMRNDLDINIERLQAASLATREEQPDGSVRTVYKFGSGVRRPPPTLPVLRRASFDDANRPECRKVIDPLTGPLEDAIAALDRYASIDRDRFLMAWDAAMHPVMESMVIGDPGHQTNRANMKVVVDTDKEMSSTLSFLKNLRRAIGE